MTPLSFRSELVFTYPLALSLVSPRRTLARALELTLTGPPGIYAVLGSPDLAIWSELGLATNQLGSAVFADATASLFHRNSTAHDLSRNGAFKRPRAHHSRVDSG